MGKKDRNTPLRLPRKLKKGIYNRLLLNILYVINQKYGLNL